MKKNFTLLSCAIALASMSASAYNVYISNQTGWDEVTLYAWGEGLADPLGGWPGLEASGTKTVNNESYDIFAIPSSLDGKSMNLIYNNNGNGSQLKDYYVTVDKDLYFAAFTTGMIEVNPEEGITPPDVKYNTLYIDNRSSWNTINVYAWASGQPDLFGGWPGASPKGSETIEGVNYLAYDMQDGTVAYNLIFNDGSSQFDGPTITPSEDVFIKVTDNAYELLNDPRVSYVTIFVENKTGWSDFYIYAYADGQPELFGGWPGAAATGTETVEGIDYITFKVKSTDIAYNLIFNNNAGTQYDAFQITPNREYYIVANADSAVEAGQSGVDTIVSDSDEAPVYYDLRGVRVENPANGMFIELRGSTARKVVL